MDDTNLWSKSRSLLWQSLQSLGNVSRWQDLVEVFQYVVPQSKFRKSFSEDKKNCQCLKKLPIMQKIELLVLNLSWPAPFLTHFGLFLHLESQKCVTVLRLRNNK